MNEEDAKWIMEIEVEAAKYGYDTLINKRLSNYGLRKLARIKELQIDMIRARLAAHTDEQEDAENAKFYDADGNFYSEGVDFKLPVYLEGVDANSAIGLANDAGRLKGVAFEKAYNVADDIVRDVNAQLDKIIKNNPNA